MNIVPTYKLEKMLLDPRGIPGLFQDAIKDDQNLEEAAKTAEDLFSKVLQSEKEPDLEAFVQGKFSDKEVEELFKDDIKANKQKGTIESIQTNLKRLVHDAEGKRYGGGFGFFRYIFHLIGLYNPKDIANLKDLSEKNISSIEMLYSR